MYAAGKIPGGFFKREGRPTERAILTARMIDRPIRPLWPKGYRNEVQCIATVLSADMVTPHDILAINGVSAALTVSPMPFLGPIGAVRIGLIDGELVVNPTLEETEQQLGPRPDRRRHEGRPDDGRGGRGPGARGRSSSRRSRSRTARSSSSARRRRSSARRPASRSGSTRRHRAARRPVRRRDLVAHPGAGPPRGRPRSSRRSSRREAGALSMSSTEADVLSELQTRMSLGQILEKQRSAAVEAAGARAVRERAARRSPRPSRTRRS